MAGITVALTESMKTRSGDLPGAFYKYFDGGYKSILGSWNYTVQFNNHSIFSPDWVQAHHVLDVTIPVYKFKRETVVYGSVPKSYSIFDAETGRDFSITFEEDEDGAMTALLNTLQRTIMRSSGVYNTLSNQNLGNCVISLYNQENKEVIVWTMNNIYFMGSDDVSLSYSNSESLKVKINFGCDVISFYSSKFDEII